MTVIAQQRIESASIPKVTCPQCRAHMSLSRIEPEAPDNRDRMFFECVCGFEYRRPLVAPESAHTPPGGT